MKKYIKRHISHVLDRYTSSFPAVLITGARQTGKTTLLRNFKKEADTSISYITFDDPAEQLSAVSDSKTFLQLLRALKCSNQPKLIIHGTIHLI